MKAEVISIEDYRRGGPPAAELPLVGWQEVSLLFEPKPGVELICAEICGDSLKGDGIFDGDTAVVELTGQASPGQLVAAMTPGGLVVKYYHAAPGRRVRLCSANEASRDLVYPRHAVRIVGVVRQINRRLA
jgi:SOS-response transcriptional repressor LexA